MSALDELITNRVPGAKYGFADTERVVEAAVKLASWLDKFGIYVAVSPAHFSHDSLPTLAAMQSYVSIVEPIERFVANKGYDETLPVLTAEHDYLSVDDANAIERVLVACRTILETYESVRVWRLKVDRDGNLFVRHDFAIDPAITFRQTDGKLYADYPDDVSDPEFELDNKGNLFLKFLEE